MLRCPTAGRRSSRWARRWSAGSTGGRRRRPEPRAPWRARWRPVPRTSRAGPRGARIASPTPGSLLRTDPEQGPEIWCRCDGGPHGFLSIAAHAHADALSVEVRYGGVDILADPGTYCYHGDPPWRSYFRSTIAHNTVELAGRNSSTAGGPFLGVRHARATETEVTDGGGTAGWTAEHDGYMSLDPPATHRRSVRL